jgi:hypothetical protein
MRPRSPDHPTFWSACAPRRQWRHLLAPRHLVRLDGIGGLEGLGTDDWYTERDRHGRHASSDYSFHDDRNLTSETRFAASPTNVRWQEGPLRSQRSIFARWGRARGNLIKPDALGYVDSG